MKIFRPKILVFIDGNNFYYKLKEVTFLEKESLKLLDFNYQKFAQNIIGESELVEVRYYIGAVKRQNGPNKDKSEKLYADQQRFIAKLQQQKVAIVLGNLIQHPDKTFHEKVVDVRIAVEMIRFARKNAYDIVYLVSSDTDLVPAVEEVRSFAKQVYYVGFPNGQSFGLTKASNNTILLREKDIIPCFKT